MPEQRDFRIDVRRARKNFNAAAHHYDEAAVLQREVGQRLVDRLDYVNCRPATIMDLGSGTGRTTEQLRRRFRKARILQVDFAIEMLEQAAHRSRRWFSRKSPVCAAAEALPFAGTVDMTFSNLMLQWCNEPGLVFSQVHDAMIEGGLFIFSSFGPDTLTELRQSWAAVDGDTHVNMFLDMHDLGDALASAGFQNPVMEAERFTLTYDDVPALYRDLKGLGAANTTAGRRRTLTGKTRLQQVAAAYNRFRQAGRLPATFEVVYGHAWNSRPGLSRMQAGVAAVPVSRIKRTLRD